MKSYSVIRYGTPNGFYIDIISTLGDTFSYDDVTFDNVDYEGINIKVATPETLFNMKKNTIRKKDKIDASFLEKLISTQNKS